MAQLLLDVVQYAVSASNLTVTIKKEGSTEDSYRLSRRESWLMLYVDVRVERVDFIGFRDFDLISNLFRIRREADGLRG